MTKKELVKQLKNMPDNAKVVIEEVVFNDWLDIEGLHYNKDTNEIRIS